MARDLHPVVGSADRPDCGHCRWRRPDRAFVRRRYPALTGDEHNDVTKFTYGFIGFVYAFFIGFVVSSMWGQINTADANAHAEGAAAVQMAKDQLSSTRRIPTASDRPC